MVRVQENECCALNALRPADMYSTVCLPIFDYSSFHTHFFYFTRQYSTIEVDMTFYTSCYPILAVCFSLHYKMLKISYLIRELFLLLVKFVCKTMLRHQGYSRPENPKRHGSDFSLKLSPPAKLWHYESAKPWVKWQNSIVTQKKWIETKDHLETSKGNEKVTVGPIIP